VNILVNNSASGRLDNEPNYLPQGDEIELFEAARQQQLAALLKGPTGCGKTRFVEHMAWRLKLPLTTVACHDDLTASDLLGRYLIVDGETRWVDGPLAEAARRGGICYLDEIIEARKDTTVVIHPLTDDRRVLPIDRTGELLQAPDDFMLVVSYNPGYQHSGKDLKPSTRQRFVAIEFDYPDREREVQIVVSESGVDADCAGRLVDLARLTRKMKGDALDEGASTRLLVHAARLIAAGMDEAAAVRASICAVLSDRDEVRKALDNLADSVLAR
jgi:nitric oxide reductase NorQ protein